MRSFKKYIAEESMAKGIIKGSVYLSGIHIKHIPEFLSNIEVRGSFDIARNNLTSLKNCPYKIEGGLYFNNNKLKSLDGICQIYLGNNIVMSYNQIESLEGLPKLINITNINLKNNKLKSLVGLPKECINLNLASNDFRTFDGGPEIIHNYMSVGESAVSLDGFPKQIGGTLYLDAKSRLKEADILEVCDIHPSNIIRVNPI